MRRYGFPCPDQVSRSAVMLMVLLGSPSISSAQTTYVNRPAVLQYVENACLDIALRSPGLLALQILQGITPQQRCQCMAAIFVASHTDSELRSILSKGLTGASLSSAGQTCVAVQR